MKKAKKTKKKLLKKKTVQKLSRAKRLKKIVEETIKEYDSVLKKLAKE